MNWDALGAIAESLGAVGVIVTLIYLSAQIRHNNSQLRGAATTAVYEYQRTLTDTLNSDSELYKIALRGNEDLSSLDPWEQQRFAIWCLHETSMWEMCHRLFNQGALDEELFRGKESYWLLLHSSPGRREWWNTQTVMLNEEFRQYVSGLLGEIPVRKLGQVVPIFDSIRDDPQT
jgi:hypothetical protein